MKSWIIFFWFFFSYLKVDDDDMVLSLEISFWDNCKILFVDCLLIVLVKWIDWLCCFFILLRKFIFLLFSILYCLDSFLSLSIVFFLVVIFLVFNKWWRVDFMILLDLSMDMLYMFSLKSFWVWERIVIFVFFFCWIFILVNFVLIDFWRIEKIVFFIRVFRILVNVLSVILGIWFMYVLRRLINVVIS